MHLKSLPGIKTVYYPIRCYKLLLCVDHISTSPVVYFTILQVSTSTSCHEIISKAVEENQIDSTKRQFYSESNLRKLRHLDLRAGSNFYKLIST